MKSGLLLLLVAGAVAALLSAWLFLGNDSTSPAAAEGPLGTNRVMTLSPSEEPALEAVEARLEDSADEATVDRRSLVTKGAGATAASAEEEVVEAATGPYTGRLVDSLGRPMAGVEVTLDTWENASRDAAGALQVGMMRKRKPASTTTGDDGQFELEPRKSLGRSLGVTTAVAGYSDGPIQCVLDPEKGRALGDVVLQPAVIVSGWVRDGDDRAVAGARVRRVDRNGDTGSELMDAIGFGELVESVRTDADGRFELPHESEGPISLLVDSDEILPKRWDGPTKRAGEVLQDIVIEVERAGQIRGYVAGYPKDRHRGQVAALLIDEAASDAETSGFSQLMAAQLAPAGDITTTIEGDGSFTLAGLVPGAKYRIRAITKNMFTQTVELSDAVDARAGGEPATLQFDPGTTLTFQVIDAKTLEPIETLTVSGKYGSQPAYLQLTESAEAPPDRFPNGKVTAFELRPKSAPAKLTLTVDAPGYFRTRDIVVDVPESGTVNLGKVALDPAPLLRFRIVDAATKKPIRRARVTVEPTAPPTFDLGGRRSRGGEGATDEEKESQEAAEAMVFGEYRVRSRGRSDRDGRCPLSMVEAPSVTLEVEARGYADHVQAPFFAPENDENEIVIELFGGGSLQAFVTDTENVPAADVRVECQRDSGERLVSHGEKTDENGIAEFEHLAPGTWEVRAFRRDDSLFAEGGRGSAAHPTEWTEIQVRSGQRQRVDLEVPAVGDLKGLVLLGNQPSPDARVSLASPESVDRTERMLEFQDRFAGMNPDTTTGVTDFEGRFLLTSIIPGDYVLLTRHPDLAMVVRTEVKVTVGKNSMTVRIPGTALVGRVVDDNGAPIAGAAVSVERRSDGDEAATERSFARSVLGSSAGATATTDVDGRYRLIGVNADADLAVVVEAKGYADAREEPVRAIADDTVSVPPISMERAGAIHITSDPEGAASTVSFVRATAVAGRALEMRAAPKMGILRAGNARIDGLVAGTWEVTVQTTSTTPGEETQISTLDPKKVEIKPGETAELRL
ncbi:Nickel uptake substrate-specific transmembrane region [Planctomycetes bacterium Poly30]|uniref:Nickel uptake substrate-specific transmembrane region n=1 Tax=Saltatorellus ferox TaxID=2528018 RepID=A0A518ELB6_9BACT|nr:Nickel uptake substrate-specific transmembrane region [Planctomycetes bacterium Poly30]